MANKTQNLGLDLDFLGHVQTEQLLVKNFTKIDEAIGGGGGTPATGDATATADTLALRTDTATLKAADAADADDLTTLGQVEGLLDTRMTAAQRLAIDALPATGATIDDLVAALKAV